MFDQFRRVIEMEPDSAACAQCLGELDDYITAQLDGADYVALFPETAEHLDACVECASAYARLYDLAVTPTVPQPEKVPEPDLGFFPQESLLSVLTQHFVQQEAQLRFRLSEMLLVLLRPTPAAATRSAGRLRYELSPEQAAQIDLPLTFQVFDDPERPGVGRVEITVEPPGQSWPDLGGKTVALSHESQTRHETTDAWGVAIFRDVPLDQLAQATVEVMID